MQDSFEKIPTTIEGLELNLTKFIGDARGFLAEMLQGGWENPLVKDVPIGNIYSSVATGKHIGRAAHFHFKNREIFFTLTGTALWLFHDFREGSPTFGQSWGYIAGMKKPEMTVHHPVYVLEEKHMARVVVPTGVYHAYWPLTEEVVMVVALASVPHDDADYDRRKPAVVPGFPEVLSAYGSVAST